VLGLSFKNQDWIFIEKYVGPLISGMQHKRIISTRLHRYE